MDRRHDPNITFKVPTSSLTLAQPALPANIAPVHNPPKEAATTLFKSPQPSTPLHLSLLYYSVFYYTENQGSRGSSPREQEYRSLSYDGANKVFIVVILPPPVHLSVAAAHHYIVARRGSHEHLIPASERKNPDLLGPIPVPSAILLHLASDAVDVSFCW